MVQSKPRHLSETLLVAFAGGFLFDLARFPAGWMAGAMVAVAIAALAGRPMFMPTLLARVFFIALGITVGGIATPDTVRGMMTWPLNIVLIAVAMLVTTLAASVYLTRVHGWSAQTAMFAAVPGALSQVVVMAADHDDSGDRAARRSGVCRRRSPGAHYCCLGRATVRRAPHRADRPEAAP